MTREANVPFIPEVVLLQQLDTDTNDNLHSRFPREQNIWWHNGSSSSLADTAQVIMTDLTTSGDSISMCYV